MKSVAFQAGSATGIPSADPGVHVKGNSMPPSRLRETSTNRLGLLVALDGHIFLSGC